MGVTAQWLKFSLNKFRERFQIREIREIKYPRNISAIRYTDASGMGLAVLVKPYPYAIVLNVGTILCRLAVFLRPTCPF